MWWFQPRELAIRSRFAPFHGENHGFYLHKPTFRYLELTGQSLYKDLQKGNGGFIHITNGRIHLTPLHVENYDFFNITLLASVCSYLNLVEVV